MVRITDALMIVSQLETQVNAPPARFRENNPMHSRGGLDKSRFFGLSESRLRRRAKRGYIGMVAVLRDVVGATPCGSFDKRARGGKSG